MPARNLRTLYLGGLAALAACGDSTSPLTTGSIEVAVVSSGTALDPDGYQLSVDGGSGPTLGATASVTLAAVTPGSHQVQLSGLAANCALTSPNPLTISVTAATTARVDFRIVCNPITPGIQVLTHTALNIPPIFYSFSVDSGPPITIGPNGSSTVSSLAPGDHTVALTAPGCTVATPNPRTLTVAAGQVSTTFNVSCPAPGTGAIQVQTSTGGAFADPNGYIVILDSVPGPRIPTSGTITLSGLSLGPHSVGLGDMAAGCILFLFSARNPTIVTASNSVIHTVRFNIYCGP